MILLSRVNCRALFCVAARGRFWYHSDCHQNVTRNEEVEMGRKSIWMMCAVFAAGMCFGETIDVAAGETLEFDLRECQVTNAADTKHDVLHAFDREDAAVFTDPDATGFTLTNQVTACALPAAPCGLAVADSTGFLV